MRFGTITKKMCVVEIFKTSVESEHEAAFVIRNLQSKIPNARINFDLHDCDNILRIENVYVPVPLIMQTLEGLGHSCLLLQ